MDGVSITQLKGVGDKTASLLKKLNILTVRDAITYFPRDYETYDEPVYIAETVPGQVVAIAGQIVSTPTVKKVRALTIVSLSVKDTSGVMSLTFFNQPYLKNTLKAGSFYIFYGKVQAKGMSLLMESPKVIEPREYEVLRQGLWPRYSLTKGLTNRSLQKIVGNALEFHPFEAEIYPAWFLEKYHLVTSKEAYRRIHFPRDFEDVVKARRRLVFDEFFSFIYFLRANKEQVSRLENHFPMIETADTHRFLEVLPYDLTRAQKKVWAEIRNDLSSPYSMNRLVQGDVGSGKTIIAILSLLECAANGYQGALMAPTEVLASQHYEDVMSYVECYHIALKPILLVGSMTPKEKKAAYEKIASGEVNLVIGTHAIIQEKVSFAKLGLVVTDEQHRFGVRQRETLASKGDSPHVLVMSATPIPRTLAIILYGDLQISVIDELPANRLPIKNCVVNTQYRPKAYSFIEKQVEQGRQVYVICPMAEEGDADELENVVSYSAKLREELPAGVQVAYLHGKLKPAEKNRIMEEFGRKNIDVLVATTVIEVGINVPNATVMMVENAERFGLAQLHQLRGRVGRGEHQSYCIFVSSKENKETMERLDILNRSNDGFFIASQDLKMRGPGDLFGIRQSGEFSFSVGDVYTDSDILKETSDLVDTMENGMFSSEEKERIEKWLLSMAHKQVDFRSI